MKIGILEGASFYYVSDVVPGLHVERGQSIDTIDTIHSMTC